MAVAARTATDGECCSRNYLHALRADSNPYPLHPPESLVADLPPGVIPISADEYDLLYPRYQREAKGRTFQEWLKATRKAETRKRIRVVSSYTENQT